MKKYISNSRTSKKKKRSNSYIWGSVCSVLGFSGGASGKESACNAEDVRRPGSGRFPGRGHGNPLQQAWRILWTEEPGGLWSIGSKRVGYD